MSGFFYARRHDLALDAAKWITVHPNGKGPNLSTGENIKGRRMLIDGETGTVLGGAGGKFNGKKISNLHDGKKPTAAEKKEAAKIKRETVGKGDIKAPPSANKQATANPASVAGNTPAPTAQGEELASEIKGAGPFAAAARRMARENPEKFAQKLERIKQSSEDPVIAGARAYWQSQNKKDPNIPVSASEQIKDTKIKSSENFEALSQYGHVYMDDYGHKRLYLDPKTLGMEVKKTANGKLISATVNGEKLSNIKAKGLLSGDTYIDLKTGELTGGHSERFNDYFRDKINNIVSENFVSGTTTEHKKADWEIKKDRVDDYEAKGKEIDKQIHDLVDNPMMNYSDPKFQRQLKELRDKRQKLDQENAKTYEEFFKARPEQNNFTVAQTGRNEHELSSLASKRADRIRKRKFNEWIGIK